MKYSNCIISKQKKYSAVNTVVMTKKDAVFVQVEGPNAKAMSTCNHPGGISKMTNTILSDGKRASTRIGQDAKAGDYSAGLVLND